jgi:hypothetical protein
VLACRGSRAEEATPGEPCRRSRAGKPVTGLKEDEAAPEGRPRREGGARRSYPSPPRLTPPLLPTTR